MIPVRLTFYALYVVLGLAIVVRLVLLGPRWETLSGLVLGAALVGLGAYRIAAYVRLRKERQR